MTERRCGWLIRQNTHGVNTMIKQLDEKAKKRIKGVTDIEAEFIDHSNRIEREYTYEAFEDAMNAWDYLKKQKMVTLGTIQFTHELLMKRLRPDIAGFWRRCNVWIGGHLKPFISVQLIEEELGEVLTLLNSPQEGAEAEEKAKMAHVIFERIHPFEDGNGRVGRMLYNWHRMKLGLPLHVIHEGKEQRDYYKWFN